MMMLMWLLCCMIMNFCVQIIGNNTRTQTTDERKMLSGEKEKIKTI